MKHLLAMIVVLLCVADGRSAAQAQTLSVTGRENIIDDDKVLRILKDTDKPRRGSVQVDAGGKQQTLTVLGRKIHSAARIDDTYSSSSDNTIAWVAYSSELPPIGHAEVGTDGKLKASIGEIWVKSGNLPPRKISPPGFHAKYPCMSSDGKLVAFTVSHIHKLGFANQEQVMVARLSDKDDNRQLVITQTGSHEGVARALRWDQDNILIVYVSEEANGSKARIERVVISESPGVDPASPVIPVGAQKE